jgi:hypothetical protein
MKQTTCNCTEDANGCLKCPIHRKDISDRNRLFVRQLFHSSPGNLPAAQEEDMRLTALLEWHKELNS